MILVPESWFKELLRMARKAEIEWEYSYSGRRSTAISSLIGYAKSSESILKFNERQLLTTKPQGK